MIDFFLKYILWYEFLKHLDAQRDFDKHFVKTGQVEQFLSQMCSSYPGPIIYGLQNIFEQL